MLKKVPDSQLKNIAVGEEEIILNGPPGNLMGSIELHNKNESKTRIKFLDLKATKSKKTESLNTVPLYINSKLRPGEKRMEHLMLSIDPNTRPGTYENQIDIGGKKRKVTMVVQPTISVAINPTEFTFQGTAPETKHTATFTVVNTGNMPFEIPKVTHVAPLDMDLLCRAFGYGFRYDKEEGFTDTMDHVTRNLKENMPNWANSKVKEAGQVLEPGKSMLVNIEITIPENAKAENDYDLTIRFWEEQVSCSFKSHTTNP
ncbi:COG1470 family protein [Marixanthomonas spongiae]|uniref:Uncharacterized protein n=1 Tax=Marixanthomonas spongiae TaxID=2174845 RepID=A0A2U0HVE5_9FLAO|nr:hypothetical protein [Marixanthomonas spongiae]PVW12842.1 hypothetical protein DDV96_14555 [Marixanthomonas spongiae]